MDESIIFIVLTYFHLNHTKVWLFSVCFFSTMYGNLNLFPSLTNARGISFAILINKCVNYSPFSSLLYQSGIFFWFSRAFKRWMSRSSGKIDRPNGKITFYGRNTDFGSVHTELILVKSWCNGTTNALDILWISSISK